MMGGCGSRFKGEVDDEVVGEMVILGVNELDADLLEPPRSVAVVKMDDKDDLVEVEVVVLLEVVGDAKTCCCCCCCCCCRF
jgi:hypothetical protein